MPVPFPDKLPSLTVTHLTISCIMYNAVAGCLLKKLGIKTTNSVKEVHFSQKSQNLQKPSY